jgi:CDP-glucose 4,6-dehydratase
MVTRRRGQVDADFWLGKKVFLTGHTGFKGSWLSLWLASMQAEVTGFSLAPQTKPSLFDIAEVASSIATSHTGNICDADQLCAAVLATKPDIVIHMAAQALVRYSYDHPTETFETNIMGTVNLLEAVRRQPSVKAVVVVTTDKCYENNGVNQKFTENQAMGGHDPYSSSKGCAELIVAAYQRSYFNVHSSTKKDSLVAMASARAGNVIGGGDWATDRLIPDAIKSFESNQPLVLRYPGATRPWQHVLEPLAGYLLLAQNLYNNGSQFAGAWNFGPSDSDSRSVEYVVDLLIAKWGGGACWQKDGDLAPHEAQFLALDCTKAQTLLGWQPRWNLNVAIEKIVSWHKACNDGRDMTKETLSQIGDYQNS